MGYQTSGTTPTLAWEVIGHGWDGDQYFPGCGTAWSDYEHVATGAGYTAREALEDALEQAAGWENAPAPADLDVVEAGALVALEDVLDEGPCRPAHARTVCCDVPGACDENGGENRPACDCGCHNPEWRYRVSIRWRALASGHAHAPGCHATDPNPHYRACTCGKGAA